MQQLLAGISIPDLIQSYALWLVFVVVALEGMGVPVPGETALVSAALYAGSSHRLSIVAVIGVACAAAILGDNSGYVIGRSFGRSLAVRYGRYLRVTEPRLAVGEYLFLKHGAKIVFVGRFFALLRTFAPLLAGVDQMRWRRFVVVNALGGLCWSVAFGSAAYFFSAKLKRVTGPASWLLAAAALAFLAAGIIFFRRNEKEIEQRARVFLKAR